MIINRQCGCSIASTWLNDAKSIEPLEFLSYPHVNQLHHNDLSNKIEAPSLDCFGKLDIVKGLMDLGPYSHTRLFLCTRTFGQIVVIEVSGL